MILTFWLICVHTLATLATTRARKVLEEENERARKLHEAAVERSKSSFVSAVGVSDVGFRRLCVATPLCKINKIQGSKRGY